MCTNFELVIYMIIKLINLHISMDFRTESVSPVGIGERSWMWPIILIRSTCLATSIRSPVKRAIWPPTREQFVKHGKSYMEHKMRFGNDPEHPVDIILHIEHFFGSPSSVLSRHSHINAGYRTPMLFNRWGPAIVGRVHREGALVLRVGVKRDQTHKERELERWSSIAEYQSNIPAIKKVKF